MRLIGLSSLAWPCALGAAAASALLPTDAAGGWPPSESATAADMAAPESWPDDPAYGYSAQSDGQWPYYAFIPEPAGDIKPRPQETAAGMAVDLAWRITIGDPRVRIAVVDSGILWDEEDLRQQVWLNPKELRNHRPLLSSGDTCGGEGELEGLDCNGDGALTVEDYKDTPSLAPPASEGRPQGDRNRNGRLDAGDLILSFSDGIDDDENGYADDIAGWDFFKDDNDPFDDTEGGHGTAEAQAAAAKTNNGVAGAGACPRCRFVPLRVGDATVAEAHDVAKAILYAADSGVSVIQCPVSTIDNAGFLQAALDYAASQGALVVTSTGNEGSRYQSALATSNHALPVRAIRYSGDAVTSATTFLAASGCANFGGQGLLSASSAGCSSEATGVVAGAAGLVYSASLEYGLPLSAAEALGVLVASADEIDVPESQKPNAPYRWSQPGFDQRFGYGRADANRAVEAVRDGRIPPSLDITSPPWFEVLYVDRANGPIPIRGSIAARRANSYDYVVEWAPGVQPLDAEFRVLAQEMNVPSTTTLGLDEPLASLDVRTVDTMHARDVDSPRGENDAAITVRLRAVAHYGGKLGNVAAELRRVYYVHSDPTLMKGFPIHVGESGASPKIADVDGDGRRDLIYATAGGVLHVVRASPSGPRALAGFPFRTRRIDGLSGPEPGTKTPVYLGARAYQSGAVEADRAREPILSAPAIADLDGDGHVEIVVSTWHGTIYVIGSDGRLQDGWPLRLPEVPSCPRDAETPSSSPCMSKDAAITRGASASPVLADLDGDGALDIIQAAFDGKLYAFDASGAPLTGWPVDLHEAEGPFGSAPTRSRILATPAVADLNGDGLPDLLVGTGEPLGADGQAGAVYLVDARGTEAPRGPVLPGWPVSMTSRRIPALLAGGITSSAAIGRFGEELAAVVHGNGSSPLVLPASPGAQADLGATPQNALPRARGRGGIGLDPADAFGPLSAAESAGSMLPLFAHPSLGDLDQDGVPDVITSGASQDVLRALESGRDQGGRSAYLLAAWSGKTGRMLPGSPFPIEDAAQHASQVVVDVDGDAYPEIVTGSGTFFLRAFDGCGREPRGFPKFTGQTITQAPAVGDLDGDGKLEVVVGTRNGWLYAWRTEATADALVAWESVHHDNRNTGNLETALGQSNPKRAATPLTPELCAGRDQRQSVLLRAGGGCTCALAGDGADAAMGAGASAWLAALSALGARVVRRRRT